MSLPPVPLADDRPSFRMSDRDHSIREFAELFGVTPRTLRFYEEKGFFTPNRTQGQHRLYGRADAERLEFVLACRKVGLGLDVIAELVSSGEGACARVHAALRARLDELRLERDRIDEQTTATHDWLAALGDAPRREDPGAAA